VWATPPAAGDGEAALAVGGATLHLNHLDNADVDRSTALLALRSGDAIVLCSQAGAAVFDVTGTPVGTDGIDVPVAARTTDPVHTNVLPGASEAASVYICHGP
jgi:hypothetical protein